MFRIIHALLFMVAVASAQYAAAQSVTPQSSTQQSSLPLSTSDTLDNYTLYHSRFSLSIIPTWTFSNHTSDFLSLDGIDCGVYTNGKGNGPGIGVGGEYGLGSFAVLGLSTSILNEGGTFSYPLPLFPVLLVPGTTDTLWVARDHSLITNITALDIAASVKVYPFSLFFNHNSPLNRIFLNLGGSFDIPISSKFDQREIITNTNQAVFLDGTSNHSIATGTIPGMGPHVGAIFGAGYDIPITRTISVSPQVSYDLALTPVNDILEVNGTQWKTNYLNLGAVVRLTFPISPAAPPAPSPVAPVVPPAPPIVEQQKPVTPPTFPPPPKEPIHPVLKVNIAAQTPNGQPPPPIIVEEVHVRESFPILNYIFFDSAHMEIPSRYEQLDSSTVKSFNERDLPASTLGVYHNILNIIGSRLALNPESHMTITGCIDEFSETKSIAKVRAENIRNYFINVWGINPRRLRIVARGTPSSESNPDYPQGRDENRRVELSSDDKEDIFAPVVVVESERQSTLANNETDSSSIDFTPSVISVGGIHNWKLSIGTGSNTIRTYEGADSVPESIPWDLKDNKGQPPNAEGTIWYSFSTTDNTGQTVTTPQKTLAIDQHMLTRERTEVTSEKHTIEKFSLIIFDYNSKDISHANKTVAEGIAQRIQPNSDMTVIGYTDQLGGDDYDKDLSMSRAQNVADILQRYSHVAPANFTIRGEGKTDIFSNDTPEGRFFCRTVQVMINTRSSEETTLPENSPK